MKTFTEYPEIRHAGPKDLHWAQHHRSSLGSTSRCSSGGSRSSDSNASRAGCSAISASLAAEDGATAPRVLAFSATEQQWRWGKDPPPLVWLLTGLQAQGDNFPGGYKGCQNGGIS